MPESNESESPSNTPKSEKSPSKKKPSPEPGEPAPLWKDARLQGALLFLLTLLVYIPAFSAGFTWDDDITITRNALVQLPEGLGYIWASKQATDYYPLTWTTFWIEWRLWGHSPYGYHIVNVLLHALSSLFLWRILIKLAVPGAWVAALLFAIHPFCVDSVVWISQRKNTLCMVFFFAAILTWLKHEENLLHKWKTWLPWLACAWLLFACSLLSKASVIALPFVLIALSWYRDFPFPKPSTRKYQIERSKLLRFLVTLAKTLPFFALSAFSAFTTLWFQGKVLGHDADGGYRAFETITGALSSSNSETGANLLERFLITGRVFWFYIIKIIVPTGIAMVYPKWPDPSGIFAAVPTFLMIAAGISAWLARKKYGRGLFTAFVCLIFGLFPVLGMFAMSYHYYSYVANHLGYLAVPTVVAVIVGYTTLALPRIAKNSPQAPAALAIIVAALFAWQTAYRASLYQSPNPQAAAIRLWEDNTKKVPTAAAAWNELGIAQGANNDWEDARKSFVKSIEVDGGRFSKPWNNLGTAHANLGDAEKALEAFKKATELNPLEFDAWGNMGTMLLRLEKPEEAVEVFDRTLELRPMSPSTYHNKGLALERLGRSEEAEVALARATEMNSANPGFRSSYAFQLFRNKKPAQALPEFLRAIELGSPDPNTYNAAAWIMATNNDPALRNGQQSLAITQRGLQVAGGNHVGLIATQAAALAELGRFDDAVAVLQKTLPIVNASQQQVLIDRYNNDIQRYQARQPMRE
ncbi:MAG: tetratricopeptide repeat protein [Verrucomicrobiota bacterium]